MAVPKIRKAIDLPAEVAAALKRICEKTGENATQVIIRLIMQENSKK